MVGSVLLKSFNDPCPSPTPIMDFEAPWYRYCRPTAPVPSMPGSVEVASTPAAAAADLLEGHTDQENLSPSHPPTASSPFVQPLTAVSNILLSPIMFGGTFLVLAYFLKGFIFVSFSLIPLYLSVQLYALYFGGVDLIMKIYYL